MYVTPDHIPRTRRMLANTMLPNVQTTSRRPFRIHKNVRTSTPLTENFTSSAGTEGGSTDLAARRARREAFLNTECRNRASRSRLRSSSSSSSSSASSSSSSLPSR
uniref:Uncharacterized protein n=1 Tax=Zea mays TaxID=4577 RepID=C0PM43_MAIZE|nr:unknown [Zea mays]